MFHAESESVFETRDAAERASMLEQGVDDVTGDPAFEQRFLADDERRPLHLIHRPKVFGDVLGQDEVIKSLRAAVASARRQHTYFFIGPAGTGKTTLARIMCDEFSIDPDNITEVNGSVTNGVDDVRVLLENLHYRGFGENPGKAIIIDECQRLSAQAWDALLKDAEEAPAHVYFFFCSTNPAKIPKAMLTRGPNYTLKPLRNDDLLDLLERVADAERIDISNDALDVVARAANGSPRAALMALAMAAHCTSAEAAQELLAGYGDDPQAVFIAAAMVKGSLRWADVTRLLNSVDVSNVEGLRLQVVDYLSKVLMTNNGSGAPRLLDMLQAFSRPMNPADKLAPLLLAFGEFTVFK